MNTEGKKHPFSHSANSWQHAIAFERKIKMLLVMPLLMLPFLTMGFWALGGGKGKEKIVTSHREGLNLQLPSANLKQDEGENKLSFYEKAEREEEMLDDDNYLNVTSSDSNSLANNIASDTIFDGSNSSLPKTLNSATNYSISNQDSNEQKIMLRIHQLQHEINQPAKLSNKELKSNHSAMSMDSDVDHIKQMMNQLQEKKESDPELQSLEDMLDKIIDIQHPNRVKERIKEKSLQQKRSVFPVLSPPLSCSNSFLSIDTGIRAYKSENAFYSILKETENMPTQNAVEAVVHETKLVANGSKIKLRLLNDIYINGILIPAGNFMFAEAAINDLRLQMEIHSIIYNRSVLPVQLTVYDLDGIAGIDITEKAGRDVVKQGAANGLQGIELSSINSSVASQATSAGINIIKSLLGRRIKHVKVPIESGHKALLVNTESAQ